MECDRGAFAVRILLYGQLEDLVLLQGGGRERAFLALPLLVFDPYIDSLPRLPFETFGLAQKEGAITSWVTNWVISKVEAWDMGLSSRAGGLERGTPARSIRMRMRGA